MNKPTITIFGLGRIGSALNNAFINSNYTVHSTFTSSEFPEKLDDLGDLIFLAVPDDKIEVLANKLSSRFHSFQNKKIIHCSGSLSSSVLQPFKKLQAFIGSFHPLKAVTEGQESFKDVWFDVEGDKEVTKVLEQISTDFEAHAFEISAEAKPLLHAAAVISSNYLVTLVDVAIKIAAKADINTKTALKVLLPLSQSTLDNINKKGINKALTGPIARGDIETIKKHQQVLAQHTSLLKLYNSLGNQTISIAEDVNDEQINAMKKLLGD